MKWFARALFVGLVAAVLVVLATLHVRLDHPVATGGLYPSVLELVFWCVVFVVVFLAAALAIVGAFVWSFNRGWKEKS